MQLGAFHQLVSNSINRGTKLDVFIPTATEMAALWLEQNHTYLYMERFETLEVNHEAATPRRLDLSGLDYGLKAIKFLRYTSSTGLLTFLPKVEAADATAIDTDWPTGYWLSGMDYLWLDNTPSETFDLELGYDGYTVWSSDTFFEPWLLKRHWNLMLHQTIVEVSIYDREPGLRELHLGQRDAALKASLDADFEARHGGVADLRMEYGR